MANGPSFLPSDPAQYNMTVGPMSGRMGEGAIGSLMMMLMGEKMWPLSTRGAQSQYDALWQRQHSMQMMDIGRNAAANWFPLRNIGFDPNSQMGRMATTILSQPNSPIAQFMAPILGGNPVLAQQSTFAAMAGAAGGVGLGTTAGMSIGQLNRGTEVFNQGFYNTRIQSASEFRNRMRDSASAQRTFRGAGYDSAELFQGDFGADSKIGKLATRNKGLDAIVEQISKLDKTELTREKLSGIVKTEVTPSKEFIDALTKAAKDGNKGVIEAFEKSKSVTTIRDASVLAQQAISNQNRQIVTGVNLRRSMGFAQEDIYGMVNEAIKSRLVSGKNYGDVMRLFSGTATGTGPTAALQAVEAARGYFGNEMSGKQLMQATSDFVGYSNVDLAKNPGVLADSFRTIKALSRVGNIDFNQLKTMVEQTTGLAGQGGATGRFGGVESVDIVKNAVLNAMAQSSQMTNQSVRWAGGTNAMVAARVQGAVESAQQPISYQLAALYHGGDADTKRRIADYVKNAGGTALTDVGYQNFLNTLPGGVVKNTQYAQFNTTAQQLGFQEGQAAGLDFQSMGGKAAVAAVFARWNQRMGGPNSGIAARGRALLKAGKFNEFLANKEMMVDNFHDEFKVLVDNGYMDKFVEDINPRVKAERQSMQRAIKASSTFEKNIAKDMGYMNASTMTRLVQAVINGDVTQEGIGALGTALGMGDTTSLYGQATLAQKQIENIRAGTLAEGLSGAGLTGSVISDLQIGARIGVTGAQLARIREGKSAADVLTKDQLHVTTKFDRMRIEELAQSNVLKDFHGTVSDKSLREFYIKKTTDKLIDDMDVTKTAEVGLNSELTKKGGILDDLAKGQLGKGLTEGDKKTEGFYKLIKGLNNDDVASGKDGYRITGSHAKLMGEAAKKKFATKDAAQAAIEDWDKSHAGDLHRATTWAKSKDELEARKDEIKAQVAGASGLPNFNEISKQLVSAMGEISSAIRGTTK